MAIFASSRRREAAKGRLDDFRGSLGLFVRAAIAAAVPRLRGTRQTLRECSPAAIGLNESEVSRLRSGAGFEEIYCAAATEWRPRIWGGSEPRRFPHPQRPK